MENILVVLSGVLLLWRKEVGQTSERLTFNDELKKKNPADLTNF